MVVLSPFHKIVNGRNYDDSHEDHRCPVEAVRRDRCSLRPERPELWQFVSSAISTVTVVGLTKDHMHQINANELTGIPHFPRLKLDAGMVSGR